MVTLLVIALARVLIGTRDTRLQRRLGESSQADPRRSGSPATRGMASRVLETVAKPFAPTKREKQSKLRRQLGQAGIYSSSAGPMLAGAKVICLFGGVGLGYLAGAWLENMMLGLSLGGLLGYVLPTFWLLQKIKSNRKQLNLSLPDALDLMVVCIEAGLTVDSAMQRVGTELQLAHPALSREFGIAHMETRVGLSRGEALRNLGQRTEAEGLQSLATMLIQADRFGTSIAQALRIHADSLRVQRQQQAEELAAKASVKMSFPLVLFIFPATFIVLAGPTVIGLMNSPMFK
jgi:tight adherence protein C